MRRRVEHAQPREIALVAGRAARAGAIRCKTRCPRMKPTAVPHHRIELNLRELGQLFNSMDPTPFHHKDLDPDAEEFIKNWALEFPPDSRYHITIHVEQYPAGGDPTDLVAEAIHNYFEYK